MFNFQKCSWCKSAIVYLCLIGCTASAQKKYTLEDIIPPNYNFLSVPKNDFNERISVRVHISQMRLRTIYESEMTFSVSLEMWLCWNDDRLRYPSWIGEHFTILDNKWMEDIWNPKVYFRNAVEGKLDNIINPSSIFYFIRNNTKLCNINRVLLKLISEMELHPFPHDQQKCNIEICSSTFATKDLYLTWDLTKPEPYVYVLHQYGKKDFFLEDFIAPLGPNTNISCLRASVELTRKTGYYIINVYIPTVLIVVMSMLTFWIPTDAVPARITLGVTSLLTIITKQYQAEMPDVSYIVALNVWLSACIAFVFFSLLEFATVIALSSNKATKMDGFNEPEKAVYCRLVEVPPFDAAAVEKNTQPIKRTCNWNIVTSPIERILLKSNGTWIKCSPREESSRKDGKGWPKRLDIISRVFFPLSFGVFTSIYWYIYT